MRKERRGILTTILIIILFLQLSVNNIHCYEYQEICVSDYECEVGDGFCFTTKCINNTCENFFNPTSTGDYKCCKITTDCILQNTSENNCFLPYCDIYFTCSYLYLISCDNNNNNNTNNNTNNTNNNNSSYIDSFHSNNYNDINETSNYYYYEDNRKEFGDILGTIVGFSLFAILILSFIVVVLVFIIKRVNRYRSGKVLKNNNNYNNKKNDENNLEMIEFDD